MTVTRATSLLFLFRSKIEEAVGLVPSMYGEEKLKAVQFWNAVSEKLQEIVNSAADISALALKFDNHSPDKMTLGLDSETSSLISHSNVSSSDFIHLPSNFPICEGPEECHSENISSNNIKQFLCSNPPLAATSSEKSTHELSTTLPHIHQLSREINISENLTKDNSLSNESDSLFSAQELPSTNCDVFAEASQCSSEQLSSSPTLISEISNLHQSNKQKKWHERSKLISLTNSKNDLKTRTCDDESLTQVVKESTYFIPDKDEKLEQMDTERNIVNKTDENSSDCKNISSAVSNVSENSKEYSSQDGMSLSSAENIDESTTSTEHVVSFVISNTEEILANNQENEKKFTPSDAKGTGLICDICDQQFVDKSSLTAHQWTHTKPFACDECPAQFSTRGNLIVHVRKHTGEKPYCCPECCSRFSTKGNLKRHIKTHSGEKPWQCNQCSACFTEKKSLKIHMRRHTGEKPYQCQICGKKFAQTGILQTHLSLHNDQKAHLCEHCGKSFRQKSQLRLHKLRHDGVKKYICMTCPARFLTKGDLERHSRMHTGERPFCCELCSKGFTRQQSLNEHMNRHYGLTPYECKYCDKSFAEMSACCKHVKQHEKNEGYDLKLDESQSESQNILQLVYLKDLPHL